MRLSTSTNMLYPVQRAEHSLDTIRTLGAAGFQVLDWCATAFSNQDTVRGENPFTTSEWQGWIEAQRSEADKLGIAFKRARHFITCAGKYQGCSTEFEPSALRAKLAAPINGGKHGSRSAKAAPGQMSIFDLQPEAKPETVPAFTTRLNLPGAQRSMSMGAGPFGQHRAYSSTSSNRISLEGSASIGSSSAKATETNAPKELVSAGTLAPEALPGWCA